MNNKGQFFLLAAVIISVVIISLSAGTYSPCSWSSGVLGFWGSGLGLCPSWQGDVRRGGGGFL